MAADVGRHIRYDHVSLSLEHVQQALHGGILGDVPNDGWHPGHGLYRTKIHTYDESLISDPLLGHLQPSARCGTEVHDPVAVTEDVEAVVDLHELEGCPGPVVHLLRELVIVLVMPLLQPTLVHMLRYAQQEYNVYRADGDISIIGRGAIHTAGLT